MLPVYSLQWKKQVCDCILLILSLVFSPYVGLAGMRAHSGDQYDSGMQHPWQVLRGRLPFLSPAFKRSQFRRQVPPRLQRRERS